MNMRHVYLIAASFATLTAAETLNAETYKLSLAQPSMVCGKVLKAGDYKLVVEGETASFRMGKTVVDVAVHQQESKEMAGTTQVRYQTTGGMYRIMEEMPKGTQMKLTFGE